MNRKTKPVQPKLSLTVQYVSAAPNMPPRPAWRRWIKAALQQDVNLTLRIVDEAEGRELNKAYRGRDYATNVLTFVYDDTVPLSGDVVICAPVVAREAAEQRKELRVHYAHLAIHAALHLQGYDHEDDVEAAEMEALETALMLKLRYPDPYKEINIPNG
ncbi:MAG: rRNA maturation RNase YbeY [Gallionellales bacterium CG_4_10_14_3_um_filter_54_96]|nr:MAG: rRNA maturation RNase YbeY [Gallionellales bacterium CG03_land_8_20_14_0_80_55_15]PIV91348.1 MAG: rRNA maturation RNase YbeY [Gallionellales bacterium CG17_big_fil_post_rev_8_21_14_2_50_54_146]PIX04252.1 MAG: rRNA maturation RNase YbeY [Gallionellales bacterium CG_4_8_14_3_um_filter_54_18]PIY05452.1 MAG: rRNA maturation RNase YbeY [Gallionellales bacterium CG_4_10_14_3_um_filter_54_96]PJC03729.1 MAG: rRNA maturation RNase YbeY [Gallionellales bacterium CG_4_9_14_0_8_um_filter_55_61]HCJ